MLCLIAAVSCQDASRGVTWEVMDPGTNDETQAGSDPDPNNSQQHGVQIIVNYVKEQQDTFRSLHSRVEALEARVSELTEQGQAGGQSCFIYSFYVITIAQGLTLE